MRVTVDLFSGRPNPSFELDPDEAELVRRTIRSLPHGARPAEPPALGFRGWILEDASLGRVHVYREGVSESSGDRVDASLGVERLLLASARRHLGRDALPEDWMAS
jgi:hypothetical protein